MRATHRIRPRLGGTTRWRVFDSVVQIFFTHLSYYSAGHYSGADTTRLVAEHRRTIRLAAKWVPTPIQLEAYVSPPRVQSGRRDSLCIVGERRQEPVAAAGHRGYKAWFAPAVLESCAQVANLAVHHVAFADT
jgi:hypothetical protein